MGIARKSFIDYFAQNAGLVVSFVAGILLSRYFGKAGRGEYVLILFANMLLMNLTNMGIEISTRVFSGKTPDKVAQIHTAGVMAILGICVIVGIIVAVFQEPIRRLIFKGIPPDLLLMAVLLLPLSLYQLVWQGVMVGLGKIATYARLTMWNRIAQAAAVILLITFTLPHIRWLIYSWVIIQVVTFLVSLMILGRRYRLFVPVKFSFIKKILGFGWLVYIGNVAATLLHKLDWLMISGMVGEAGVGLYSQASMFSDKVTMIAGSLERATYQPAAKAGKNYGPLLIQKVFRYNLYVNLLGAGAMYIFGSACIHLLLKEEFSASLFPLKFLLLSVVFMSCSRILAIYFTAHLGKPKIPALINWVVLPANLILCYFFTKKWGINGACISTAITYFLHSGLFLTLFIKKNKGIKLSEFFLFRAADLKEWKKLLIKSR